MPNRYPLQMSSQVPSQGPMPQQGLAVLPAQMPQQQPVQPAVPVATMLPQPTPEQAIAAMDVRAGLATGNPEAPGGYTQLFQELPAMLQPEKETDYESLNRLSRKVKTTKQALAAQDKREVRRKKRGKGHMRKETELDRLAGEIVQNVQYTIPGTTRPEWAGPIEALPPQLREQIPQTLDQPQTPMAPPQPGDPPEYIEHYNKLQQLGFTGQAAPGMQARASFVDLSKLSPRARKLYQYWSNKNLPQLSTEQVGAFEMTGPGGLAPRPGGR